VIMKTWHILGQMLKATEGGTSQKDVKSTVHGTCEVRFEPSPLIGHYQILINTRDQKKHRRLANLLWR
jgi:hypothetical protein